MPTPDSVNVPAVDGAAIRDRFEGNAKLIREVAQLFVDACPRRLAAIREAVALGDGKALHAAVHSLRGAASNFGAAEVVAIALRLELMGRSGDLTAAAATCKALEREVERLKGELAALL